MKRQKQPKQPKQPVIRAECHSDDYNVNVEFDAERWFRSATRKDVLALAQCGWRGDYPADAVAESETERNGDVAFMFKYVNAIQNDPTKKDCCGFECSVDPDDAKKWLRKNRPEVAKLAVLIEDDPAAYDARTGTFAPGSDSRICLLPSSRGVDSFKVYADDGKTKILGYARGMGNAKKLLKAADRKGSHD
jgi:hypothetical protein